jgi:hypothetical protein
LDCFVIDPRLDAVLQPALGRIRGVVSGVLDQTILQISAQTASSVSNLQRQVLLTADRELRLKSPRLKQCFERELNALVETSLQSSDDTRPSSLANTDWASLSLVDNSQVERDVQADRLALSVMPVCERHLETVGNYIAGLLEDANPERNPLRPRMVAKALLDSLIQVGVPEDATQAIGNLLPALLGPALAGCYEQIAIDMRGHGLQPYGMAVQKSRNSSAVPLGSDNRRTEPAPLASDPVTTRPSALHARAAQALGEMFGVTMPALPSTPGEGGGVSSGAPMSMDFQNLLRQISQQAGEIGHEAMLAAGLSPDEAGVRMPGFAGPLMAVNQIRANRDELVRASGGAALDKIVIDIVAALFDQVLSDPKVAPEMARQIARMQMPVLRVALGDMNFFNSRKHPVRRFVNRIASLSAAFDDYSQGPGAECLSRITHLVNDIVDADFDRMDVYESKLRELEAFIEAEAAQDATDSAEVAALLTAKEADLRVQQRYMQIMQRELLDVDLPDFLRDFLSQVWSRVQVAAAHRDGVDSMLAQRMKAAGRELAMSVQPKGHPKLRQAFLLKLPSLMKDVNEGLGLIHLPESAKQAFFAELLPAHAACLKTAPTHDLTQRLLEQRLRQVESIAIPTQEETAGDSMPSPLDSLQSNSSLMSTSAFTAEEIRQSGFIPEAALDGGSLDIDLNLAGPQSEADPTLGELDINLDTPPPPAAGLQLVHHIQKGTPYHMVMQGKWQKVRLTWISEGRSFFIFTTGHLHKQTISLTGRTLARMCESGRFKAFEQAELIERATVRARKQLAALSSGAPH